MQHNDPASLHPKVSCNSGARSDHMTTRLDSSQREIRDDLSNKCDSDFPHMQHWGQVEWKYYGLTITICVCVRVLACYIKIILSVLPVERRGLGSRDRLFTQGLMLQSFKEKCDIPSSQRHMFFGQDFPPSVAVSLWSKALKTNMFLEEGTQNKAWRSSRK